MSEFNLSNMKTIAVDLENALAYKVTILYSL